MRVVLGCVTADRSAAVEVTGGPHFKAKASPCLRCTIHLDEIVSLRNAPMRNSHGHNVGILDQIASVPAAVEADQERWDNEQRIAIDEGSLKKQRAYPKYRRAQAVREATIFTGNLSILGLLPGFDKFGSTAFDPMHSLLEGAWKTYFSNVILFGAHGRGVEEADVGTGSDTDGENPGSSREQVQEAEKVLEEVKQGKVEPRTLAEIRRLESMIQTSSVDLGRVGCSLPISPACRSFFFW